MVLGRLRQNGSNPFEVTVAVTNITRSNVTGSNVAVLHLATKPALSDYIQPVCLDTGRTFAAGSSCWATGWSPGRGGGESDRHWRLPPPPRSTGLFSPPVIIHHFSRTSPAGAGDLGGELWKLLDVCQQHLYDVSSSGTGE